MNSFVTIEIALLLKALGYDEYVRQAIGLIHHDIIYISNEFTIIEDILEHPKEGVLCNSRMDEFNSDYISCPTIADVIDWIYNKFNIWIIIQPLINGQFKHYIKGDELSISRDEYSSYDKAYLASFKYILKKQNYGFTKKII